MENVGLYQDIAKRTDGDIYIGVVGPVRTGKSTFIKKFMDLLVIPNIDNEYKKERAKDELPQSAGGRTIMTTEPKFVPNEAVEITETLLAGVSVVLNLEGLDIELAQRLVDFATGTCVAIDGNFKRITKSIFIISPRTININGGADDLIGENFG